MRDSQERKLLQSLDTEIFSASLLSILKRCKRVVVSTGAGVSAESGAPTFRDSTGLWKQFRPEDLATPEAFQKDPRNVWEWYDWRRQKYGQIQPNPGHFALAELENRIPDFFLFTQNIDGLHQKAGSKNVYELHGNIWRARCVKEQKVMLLEENPLKQIPPLCPCGALLRPDVVWFGETVPADILDLAFRMSGNCDVFFVIGTSGLVQPAASLAWTAREGGAIIVEINPNQTPITDIADESFRAASGYLLPLLINAINK